MWHFIAHLWNTRRLDVLLPPVLLDQGLPNRYENEPSEGFNDIIAQARKSYSYDWRSTRDRTKVTSQGGTRSRDLRQEWDRDGELRKASAVGENWFGKCQCTEAGFMYCHKGWTFYNNSANLSSRFVWSVWMGSFLETGFSLIPKI